MTSEAIEKIVWESVCELFPGASDSKVESIFRDFANRVLEEAAQAVHPEDFSQGTSEWCALKGAQQSIRSLSGVAQEEKS